MSLDIAWNRCLSNSQLRVNDRGDASARLSAAIRALDEVRPSVRPVVLARASLRCLRLGVGKGDRSSAKQGSGPAPVAVRPEVLHLLDFRFQLVLRSGPRDCSGVVRELALGKGLRTAVEEPVSRHEPPR